MAGPSSERANVEKRDASNGYLPDAPNIYDYDPETAFGPEHPAAARDPLFLTGKRPDENDPSEIPSYIRKHRNSQQVTKMIETFWANRTNKINGDKGAKSTRK